MLRSPDLSPRQVLRGFELIRSVEATGRAMMGVTRNKIHAAQEYLRAFSGIRTSEEVERIMASLKKSQAYSLNLAPSDLSENLDLYSLERGIISNPPRVDAPKSILDGLESFRQVIRPQTLFIS